MSRRSSSTNRIDSGISRKIGSDLSKVIIVADNIEAVLTAASVDLEALLDALTEATDFAGITVVPGTDAHWDPITKVLTVPTVKGDKGDTGEDLSIVSITPQAGGAFTWEFSDGTTYTTPNLRGNKGDQGDQGDKGDSVELTSIVYQGEGVFVWSFSDGTVYQTPSLKGVKGDQGDQGDKGDQGDPITMEASIYQGDGSFLWKFSDGSTYRTPDLRGVRGFRGFKGDKGDQGVSVHHLKGTLTTHDGAKFGMEGETDTYTFYGDAHETIVLGWFKIQNGYNTKAFADTSKDSAALAEKWASEAVGVPVKNGKYSAFHHARKAEGSVTEAALSAAEAALSVDEAALWAVAAEDSATASEISEGIATNAASTATDAAGTAVTASGEAEATLKDFRERYYGRYTTAPTVNPYGGSIELGDLYFDEVYQELRVWAEVGGTPVWKYAGVGPKGDNFSVHKVGLRSERSLYDNEAQGFCFFAADETVVHNTPVKSVSLPFSLVGEYLLEGFVGGPQSLVVTVNGIIQPPAVYSVTDAGNGNYILGIHVNAEDTLEARELGRAFTNGAAYFKLSEVSADWSDPVPFSQGPKGDTGARGQSAYQFWLEEGNTGSIQDFIASFGDDIAVVPPKVYWGLPITENRKLLEEDIGLSFLIDASVEIELPAWDSLDSGWYINLYPNDFGKRTSHHIVVRPVGTDEIRGGLTTISGDVKVVRSAVAGQFIIIGEVKYLTMEDLQDLIFRVEDMNWTSFWYPNWFPSVQVALNRAKAIANIPNSSVVAIAEAYNELESTIQSLGIRIAYPKPYVIENGNFSGTNTFGTFDDQPAFTEGTHAGAGSVENIMVPEQPKAANTIIDQVINNSNLTPPEFLDGTSVFSYFNEVARFGNQLVGMEFSATRMQNYDIEINMLGRAVRKVGASLNYYTLGVKVYTALQAGQIKLTVRKYAKIETPTETKEDFVEASEQFPTSGVLRVGILVDQVAANLRVFTTKGELIVPDDFLTSDASSGKFSTAFEQYIDSFGLGEIKSIRRSNTSIANTMTFDKSTSRWQLDFPSGTMDYAKALLSSFKFIESNRTVEVAPIAHKSLKVVTLANLLPPIELEEQLGTVEVAPIAHKSAKVVTFAKERPPYELTEPLPSVETVTSGNKIVKVVTIHN